HRPPGLRRPGGDPSRRGAGLLGLRGHPAGRGDGSPSAAFAYAQTGTYVRDRPAGYAARGRVRIESTGGSGTGKVVHDASQDMLGCCANRSVPPLSKGRWKTVKAALSQGATVRFASRSRDARASWVSQEFAFP